MSLNDLANIGQVIGAIAVVISLIYVALQIRQNTNAVRSATAQSVHEHFVNWYHLIAADAELSRIAANGLRDYQSLSENERTRFIAAFMSFLSYSQNAFLKWRQGLLTPSLWLGWEQVSSARRVAKPSGKSAVTCLAMNSDGTLKTILSKGNRTPTQSHWALSTSAKRFLPRITRNEIREHG
jgi:hypothetical protein